MYETIAVESLDNVRTITLDRQRKLNALSMLMKDELADAIADAVTDPHVRAVILTGAGRAFCAGADLTDMRPEEGAPYRTIMRKLQDDLIGRIADSSTPFIAAVNGAAVGAGFSIVTACDVVVVSSNAFFLAPQVRLGIVPDLGLVSLLPRIIGATRARAVCLLAERVTAEKALEWGLAYDLAEPERLLETAASIARRIAEASPTAVASLKSLLGRAAEVSLSALFDLEASEQTLLRSGPDYQRAIAAFKNKAEAQGPSRTGRCLDEQLR